MIEQLLDERRHTHGDFEENAITAQQFKQTLRCNPSWIDMTSVQREALEVICAKIARIVCGNPNELDHWRDIIGYATLALNHMANRKNINGQRS